ncbi:MAG: DUF1559 domain-containing protein [Candidatus Omnitrophica bacterium]|nr:DUF1559 domain-containing protein [Candidatus Omnitrophota bacterium]
MLLPALSKARERARIATCISNLKQLGIATMMYVEDFNEFLPFAWFEGGPRDGYGTREWGSWFTLIARYLNVPVYDYYSLGTNWMGPTKPNVFHCPSQNPKTFYSENPSYTAYKHSHYAPIDHTATRSPVREKRDGRSLHWATYKRIITKRNKKIWLIDSTHPFCINAQSGANIYFRTSYRHGEFVNCLFFDMHAESVKRDQLLQIGIEHLNSYPWPYN